MVTGPECVTLKTDPFEGFRVTKTDPFEGFRARLLEGLTPVLDAHQARINQVFEPFLDAHQARVNQMFAPFLEGHKARVSQVFAPFLEGHLATILGDLSATLAPRDGLPGDQSDDTQPDAAPMVPATTTVRLRWWQKTWEEMDQSERVLAFLSLWIVLRLALYLVQITADPALATSPSAALLDSATAIYDNIISAMLVGVALQRRTS